MRTSLRRVVRWVRTPIAHERWVVAILAVLAMSRRELWALALLAPVVATVVWPFANAVAWRVVPPGPEDGPSPQPPPVR